MEICEEGKVAQKECVKVAVNIRPLITAELVNGCTDCVTVTPGESQVQIGSHLFTYDYVYGSTGSPTSSIFEDCVLPLIDSLFRGYNGTVLAYGQTGSGKTYTMGTNYTGEANAGGIIPQVMETIFNKVEMMKENTEFLIRVSFIEIFKEEVFDLLDQQPHAAVKPEICSVVKGVGPNRVPIQIRETASGGITLAGVTEAEVKTKEEMASFLVRGSLSRATASTHMNSQSSRSHAIFTICMEQKKIASSSSEIGDDILIAKLHLVDLAGSERAKRTGADGMRLKEGIHINRGLLALGNVISALGDDKKRKEGAFVPYRDSKLTRLLQDSLGGNSKTVMIACISPADSNAEETINTLKYANRARNIQNKAVINRDPVAAEMQRMRSQLEQLQAELLFSRSGGASLEELQILQQKVSLLEIKNAELHNELKETQVTCEQLAQKAIDTQMERDELLLRIESVRGGKSWDEIENTDKVQDMDLLKSYVSRIQQLETDLRRAKSMSSNSRNTFLDRLDMDKDLDDLGSGCEDGIPDESCEGEEEEKEKEHSSLQDRLDKELKELDKRLEQKEAEMKQFAKGDTSILKQHYEKKITEMEHEKKALQKEIEDLRSKLASISSLPDEGTKKLKEDYLQKLNGLESQVSELKKKQEAQAQVLRQKQKSDEAARRLQEEIHRIKSQKVQLQQKIKQESEQFRLWKALREKEVMQLKKEGRRNEYEMHKLLALNQRQKMVLQRKTEEAAMATKRLKELLEAKKASSRELPGNANGPGIQALVQAIEHELEVTVRVHEVRSRYERQMQERAAMSKEIARLKEESEMVKKKIMSDCPETMSPSARSSRISALENMLGASSATLVSMASQLSEAEERERLFGGKGRWNHVRSLPEARNVMSFLFNLASSSRCQLRDREADCREKDAQNNELKEKIIGLTARIRRYEAERKEIQLENLKLKAQLNELHFQNMQDRASMTARRSHFVRASLCVAQQLESDRPEWADDMDIDDSDASDGTDEWVPEPQENQESDSDWSIQKPKRGLKTTIASVKPEPLSEEAKPAPEITGHVQCCSCSKGSTCSRKCECRSASSICGPSCGCRPSKCSNRGEEEFIKKAGGESDGILLGEAGSSVASDEDKKDLVLHATTLLRSALTDAHEKEQEDLEVKPRKPLGDIGNRTMGDKTGAKPPRQRKNWRKSTIQLVPTEPIPPSQVPENYEAAPRNRENIPLRLPRAMSSAPPVDHSANPPLADRNAVRHDESVNNNKENGGMVPARSPVRLRKNANEKENEMR